MFPSAVYTERRNRLRCEIKSGIVLLLGNQEVAFNYPGNTYYFRQDSSFLYFFGLDLPDLAAIIDVDSNTDYIFGNDIDIEDVIWMGELPTLKDNALKVGITQSLVLAELDTVIKQAVKQRRPIHFLPPYRTETKVWLESLLGIQHTINKQYASEELIKAVVKLRSIKDQYEIAEIEKTIDIAYEMHTTAMKMAKVGVKESDISSVVEGIARQNDGFVSFPVILSVNGQILHNHHHQNILTEGRMLVCDSGAESHLHYATDFTRTVPVGGKFNQRQREIYEIVLLANQKTTEAVKPGVFYRDVHLLSATIITEGLKNLGLMKGDVNEAVAQGAHALFYPHGLGHMMGLDVHDMENLGENYVGYDDEVKRSDQFGLAYLRLARRLQSGFVFTVEPGIYFIPALIDLWKSEQKFTQFINYEAIEKYRDFGGVRIEDDVLVTETGYRILGKPIPKTVAEIEKLMAE